MKRLLALGVASNARTMEAPLLCPAIVTLLVSPLKLGKTFCRNWSAVIISFTARFPWPLGDINPKAPRRYWTTATIELVAWASFAPSIPGAVAEPMTKDPP